MQPDSLEAYPEVTEAQISEDIAKDENYYFISLLSDRFASLNDRWAAALKKRFGKNFKPIYILPHRHNDIFIEDNFAILNKQQQHLNAHSGAKKLIYLIYPEDLNKQFSESKFCQELLDTLVKKQGTVHVLSFTSVWLDFKSSNIKVLGPEPNIAGHYDNKIEHVKLFKKLRLPINKVTIYDNFEQLKRRHKEFPFFISAAYSSGGIESQAIYTPEDLDIFYFGLRPVNKDLPLIAARQIKDIVLAPNVTALVHEKDETTFINISEQLLRGNNYMGNIYPANVSKHHFKIILESTMAIGNHLSREGFRGLFGCDFLITASGECFPVDLNPRRQGGYFCVTEASPVDLVDLELKVALGEPIDSIRHEDFQADYAWGHSKLSPYFNNAYINKEFGEGECSAPFRNIGTSYTAQFYPKDHVLITGNPGFYVATAKNSSEIKKMLIPDVEKLISKSYKMYID